jgi:hypothetical protein
MAEFKLGRLKFVWKGAWAGAATYVKDDIINFGGKSYVCIQGHVADTNFYDDVALYWEMMADGIAWLGEWDTAHAYKLNDVVRLGGKTYICTTQHTSGGNQAAFYTALGNNYWTLLADGIRWRSTWNTLTDYALNDVVSFGGGTYICDTAHTSGAEFAESYWEVHTAAFEWENSWNNTDEYQTGDVVSYGGYTYAALSRNTGTIPSENIAVWKPFVEGTNHRGAYVTPSGVFAYRPGDKVTSGGNNFLAIRTAYTEITSNTTYWSPYLGVYSNSTAYVIGNTVVYSNGKTYIATQASTNQSPGVAGSAYWTEVSQALNNRGAWAAANITNQPYRIGDVVMYGGNTYINIADAYTENPENASFWSIYNEGFKWVGAWSNAGVRYKIGEVVKDGLSSFICIAHHTSSGANAPIDDITNTYWEVIADGSSSAVVTTRGDIIYRDTSGAARLPIGTAGKILAVNAAGTEPEWSDDANITVLSVSATNDLTTINGDITTTNGNFSAGGTGEFGDKVTIDAAGANTGSIYVGKNAEIQTQDASLYTGLTDAIAVFTHDVDAYAQVSAKNLNSGASASTDFIAYANNGDTNTGWIDMGITSTTFSDASYGITGPNDGYIFMSAPEGTTGNGNLYISTNNTGLQNDIVFSTNGFGRISSEKMRLIGVSHDGLQPGLSINVEVETTLNNVGGYNSSATSIIVTDTSEFPATGQFMIDSEEITYTGKTGTTFTGLTRGANGTTAASHLNAAPVVSVTQSNSSTTGALRVVGGIGLTGNIHAEGEIHAFGGAIYQGENAKSLILDDYSYPGYVGLTNASGIFTKDADDFVQFALKNHNTGNSASTDIIAYASNGDNNSGWIDMGITSETYNDPDFTVTGPNTGYLFYASPDMTVSTIITGGTLSASATTVTVDTTADFAATGTLVFVGGEQATYTGKTLTTFTGVTRGVNSSTATTHADGGVVRSISDATYSGDLLIGTGSGGHQNDIVIFSGGFDGGNERLRVIGHTRAGHAEGVEILASTISTSTSTGALRVNGGMGLIGNLNVGGNVSIVGTISIGGSGSSLTTTALAISDPMITLGKGNVGDSLDLGFLQETTSADSTVASGTLSSSNTTITVVSATAFSATGTIKIEDEEITYTGKTGTTFTGCTRGVNGTTAATHAAAVVVRQVVYSGMIRDATDAKFKIFKGLTGNKPLSTVNFSNANISMADLMVGNLSVGTDLTVTGDIAVNGGDITSSATIFNLLNTTVTTLNLGGATTTTNVGSTSGTINLRGMVSLSEVQETLLTKTGATGTVVHDFFTGAIFYHSSIAANFTPNFTNMPTDADKAYAITLILNQGGTGYFPTAVQVNSGAVTLRWANNTAPTPGTNSINTVTYTLFYTGSTWYVTAQFTKFA